QPQWLNPIDVRNSDFAEAIRDDRVSVNIRPFIINFDHFGWISIVIYCHSRITYHRHPANFVRMKPADMHMCRHPIGKSKIKMSNIMDMGLEMCMRLDFNAFWLLAKNIEQDRYIMRSKVPDDIDITAKQA